MITAEGVSASFTYDSATGNVATITDGNNHTTKYQYNSNGLITKYWDAKTPTTGTPTTSYTYYPNNIDVQYVTNGLGTITYAYNNAHDVVLAQRELDF